MKRGLILGAAAACVASLCSGVAQAAPGDVDTSFGNGAGFVRFTPGPGLNLGSGVVLQPDGKIVIAGSSDDLGSAQPFVARLLDPSGGLDPAFGAGTGIAHPVFGGSFNTFQAVALQPDGRIVAAGSTDTHGSSDLLAARLLSDGSLDTSYGLGTGASAPDFGGYESGQALALQSDGKIVVAGSGPDPGGTRRLLVARFLNPQGTLDTSYGLGTGASRPNAFSGTQVGSAVAVQPDGNIVVAGTTRQTVTSPGDFIVARFLNPAGTSDTGFGSANGGAQIDFGADDIASAMVLQPDGKILVAGTTVTGGSGALAVARLLPSGVPDNSFGTGGKAVIDLGASAFAGAMALQADGKILVAGSSGTGTAVDMAVVRLQPDGTLDTTFGRNGKSIVDFGQNEAADAIAIAPDGKIVLSGRSFAGGSSGPAIVVRLLGDPVGSGGGGSGGGGGGGTKVPRCDGRAATIIGTNGPDRLTGSKRADVIVGLGGNDTIKGLGGNDIICGGNGNDNVDGGAGNDILFGQNGKDRIAGGAGNDQLDGGGGNDTLLGQGGNDRLTGGPGHDTLNGGAGKNKSRQ